MSILIASKQDLLVKKSIDPWYELHRDTAIRPIDFERWAVCIDDFIYFQESPEFWEAYSKVKTWEKLTA